ncbi:hypothetical protein [Priestia endophytica]|uniref:hypothetical protein n=1 Tax=Priestia endophytica TaxID=135735 RepID=UPI002E1B77A8|nr:hypothetical protein [Priestia endophytica]
MIKAPFEHIVEIEKIGKKNEKKLGDVLTLSSKEKLPIEEKRKKVLFIGIDYQYDFMEDGALPVLGSHRDVENVTRFIYENLEKITNISVSLDTHEPSQIFHECWWENEQGEHPQPLTIITAEDVLTNKWNPLYERGKSLKYVQNLEKYGKKQLCIWNYHCIKGTEGASLEGQFANMIHYHSSVHKTPIEKIVKGENPLSEMYGIIKSEHAEKDDTNYSFLNRLKEYDKIIIAGEAKSHCVLESIKQITHYYRNDDNLTSNIIVLQDCMSSIQGFEEETEKEYAHIAKTHGIKLMNWKDVRL